MGNDSALRLPPEPGRPLFFYSKRRFARVTTPPIDPIREAVVMSVASGVGRELNLLDETPQHAHQLAMEQPILRNHELEKLRQVDSAVFKAHTIDITWPAEAGAEGMAAALDRVSGEASQAVLSGANILILSDRRV